MQGGAGKMRNRYRVGNDQFLCFNFSSSSHLFCSWFLFLLCLPLLVWVFLAASLSPSTLVRSLGAVFLTTWVCKFSAVEASGYLGCLLQDPAECPEEGEGAGTATSTLGWAPTMGRCQGPFWLTSHSKHRRCQVWLLFLRFGWKWQVFLIEIHYFTFARKALFSLPFVHSAVPVAPLDIPVSGQQRDS